VRGDNEDRLLVFDVAQRRPLAAETTFVAPLRPAAFLLIVADGMGGMSAGEQASQMCVDVLPEEFVKRLGSGSAPTQEQARAALGEAIVETNRRILERGKSDAKLQGMGCTLTAALLEKSSALVAQVGDSRAYLGRAGEVTQLTLDQTVWESLRAQGKDPEKALGGQSQFKSMLLQAVGAQEGVEPAFTEVNLAPEDWLVLCTDGLYRVVTSENLSEILKAASDPAEKAQALTALANQRGAPDNVSVIVCQVAGVAGMQKGAPVAA